MRAAAMHPAFPRVAGAGACAAVAAALLLWTQAAYWNYSDGVYAYSARAVLDGRGLYTDLVAAQPPPIYYAGAAVLAVADSIWALRAVLSLLAAVSGTLVAICTWRLTRRPGVAVLAGAATLLTPWALKGHLSWVPESFAAPLLLGAALLAAGGSRRAAAFAGVLGALAAGFKLAFLLPAVAVVLAGRSRAAAGLALAGVLALGTAVSLAIWGDAVWESVVTAQGQSGTRSAGTSLRLLAEAAWNGGPILLLAALAVALRHDVADRRLLVTLAAAAAAAALTLLAVVKEGSYHNVLVVAQPLAMPLAAVAVVRAGGALRVAAVALVAFMALQSASVLLSPEDPAPLPSPGGVRVLGDAEVGAAAATARACRDAAFSGPPYVAFIARRRMPGGQPDQFILQSPVHREAAARAAADARRCP